MFKSTIDTSKPLSELIIDLQNQYKAEEDQSQLFQKMYTRQADDDSPTSLDSIQQMANALNVPLKNILKHQQPNSTRIPKGSRKGKRTIQQSIKEEISKDSTQDNFSSGGEISKKIVIDPSITDKKTIQMIRNRVSAQNSRDRRKLYVKQLEQVQQQGQQSIQQLEEQISYYQQELAESQKQCQYLQQQLHSLACLSCGSRNLGYDDELPLKVAKSNPLGAIGFGFLATMCLIAMFAIVSIPDAQPTNQLMHIVNQQQQLEYCDRRITANDSEYSLLQTITNNRLKGITALMEYHPDFTYIEQTKRGILQSDENIVSEMLNINKKKNSSNGTALAPLNYNPLVVDSLYCPVAYKYQNQTNNGVQVAFQDANWIHLVIPKRHMNLFFDTDEQTFQFREYNKNHGQSEMSEVWCRVKSVNDFYV